MLEKEEGEATERAHCPGTTGVARGKRGLRQEKENERKIKKEATRTPEERGEEGFGMTSQRANKAFTRMGWSWLCPRDELVGLERH